jgi:hypothetical protein
MTGQGNNWTKTLFTLLNEVSDGSDLLYSSYGKGLYSFSRCCDPNDTFNLEYTIQKRIFQQSKLVIKYSY